MSQPWNLVTHLLFLPAGAKDTALEDVSGTRPRLSTLVGSMCISTGGVSKIFTGPRLTPRKV